MFHFQDNKGFALMFATKNKKKQAALKLMESGADIHFLDQVIYLHDVILCMNILS